MRRTRIAVCSWSLAPGNPEDLLQSLEQVDLTAVQLALTPVVQDPAWECAISVLRDRGITITSGMLEPVGEDYSTLESIARTGGIRDSECWEANRELAESVAVCAEAEGIALVTFHAGFLPHDTRDPERVILLDRLREVADLFSGHGVRLAFETGQESAATLVGALEDLACPHVGVNFDPANMILYGMGDPVDALRLLAPYVMQVHIKDARETEEPGTWGTEVPVGTGDVDWDALLTVVRTMSINPDLVVEREGGSQRQEDIRTAIALLGAHGFNGDAS